MKRKFRLYKQRINDLISINNRCPECKSKFNKYIYFGLRKSQLGRMWISRNSVNYFCKKCRFSLNYTGITFSFHYYGPIYASRSQISSISKYGDEPCFHIEKYVLDNSSNYFWKFYPIRYSNYNIECELLSEAYAHLKKLIDNECLM